MAHRERRDPSRRRRPYPNPEVNLCTGIPFVNYGDSWSFHDQNEDLGTTWKDVGYNFGATRVG